ncbi:AmmeMemoRadiSam system protein B [Planctomycetota bacterium]
MKLPAIRYVEAFPVEHEGNQYICLRDPEGWVQAKLLLAPHAFVVASCLDGISTAADIQDQFRRQFGGETLPLEDIMSVVNYLDEQGFLHTGKFEEKVNTIKNTFNNNHSRPAFLAGSGYPAEPADLRSFIDDMFTGQGGPGKPPAKAGSAKPLRVLIAPHIDFQRGGHTYAHAYHKFSQHGKPEVVFIFGVAHAAPLVPFILTGKDFETPLGTVKTDQEIVLRLVEACDWDPFEHELVHRTEHSIEFQAVMLSYLFGTDIKIVPILCANFITDPEYHLDPKPIDPSGLENINRFLDTCRDITKDSGRRAAIIAAADLAHVGKCFGDSFDITDDIIRDIEDRDREDLQYVLQGRPEKFYQAVLKDRNKRRVCGLNCIYSAMRAADIAGDQGCLLEYNYAHDPAGGIVSFAGIAFS